MAGRRAETKSIEIDQNEASQSPATATIIAYDVLPVILQNRKTHGKHAVPWSDFFS